MLSSMAYVDTVTVQKLTSHKKTATCSIVMAHCDALVTLQCIIHLVVGVYFAVIGQ